MTDAEKLAAARLCEAKIAQIEKRLAKAKARGQVEMHISLADLEVVLGLAGSATRTVLARMEGR